MTAATVRAERSAFFTSTAVDWATLSDMIRLASTLALLLLAAACGPPNTATPCTGDPDCNLRPGGLCTASPLGTDQCAYPDVNCPGGYSWSEISGSISGMCVLDVDAGIDAPVIDAPIDAPIPVDGSPTGPIVTTYQAADLVLGQSTFTAAADGAYTAATITPKGLSVANGGLWGSDVMRGRVMVWAPFPTGSNTPATRVVGRPNFTETIITSPTNANLGTSTYVAAAGGKLVVSDPGNKRVLVWNPAPLSSGVPATVVLGQPDFTSSNFGTGASQFVLPEGVWTDGVRVAVADAVNDRVLIWNAFPTTNAQPASIVLGQTGFGVAVHPSTASASNMKPEGVYFDGARFYVADYGQNRVMVWNGFPTTNNQPADFAIGQPDLVTKAAGLTAATLDRPAFVIATPDAVFVSDQSNDRVLVYTPIPTASGAVASYVLGQPDMTTGANNPAPTDRSLDRPTGLAIGDGALWVADTQHMRVLRFPLYQ